MTTLVGQDGTGFTITGAAEQQSSGNAIAFAAKYMGVPGTVDTAHIWKQVGNTTSNAKLVLYDAGGNRVAISSVIAISGGPNPGDHNAPMSATITAQLYTLVMVVDSGNFQTGYNSGSSATVDSQWAGVNLSYASPPATLPAVDVANTGHEIIMYLTGSVLAGNGAQQLMGVGS